MIIFQIFGCLVEGWCPEEDIYNKVTKKVISSKFLNVSLAIHSAVDFNKKIFTNSLKKMEFPGKHTNILDISEYIKTVGYSMPSL